MHRDTKIGLALGVLLVGVVGAFFFRNERPTTEPDVPQLADAAALDETIAEKPVIPYLQGGIETVPASEAERAAESPPPRPPTWDVPDFLRDDVEEILLDPLPPAGEESAAPLAEAAPLSPRRNADWESLEADERSKPSVAEDAARTHVVRSGDTLSGLAARYLGSTARYFDIYEANRDRLRSPDDLRVGQELRIPDRTSTAARPAESTSRPTPAKPVTATPAEAAADRPEPADADTDADADAEQPRKKKFVPARRSPFVPVGPPRRISQVPPEGESE